MEKLIGFLKNNWGVILCIAWASCLTYFLTQPKSVDHLCASERQLSDIKDDLRLLCTAVSNITIHVYSSQDTVNSIYFKVSSMETGVSSIDAKLKKIESDINAIDPSLNNITAKVNNIDTNVKSMDTEVSSIDTKLKSIDTKVDSIVGQVVSRYIGTVRGTIESINSRLSR